MTDKQYLPWLTPVSKENYQYKKDFIKFIERSIHNLSFYQNELDTMPTLVTDKDILLSWVTRSTRFMQDIKNNPVFLKHFEDKEFAKRYLENVMNEEGAMIALNKYPEFLSERWLARKALYSHFSDDFLIKNCNQWLHDKDFFNEVIAKTNRSKLFSHFMNEKAILKQINANPFQVTNIDKKYLDSKEFVLKLTQLPDVNGSSPLCRAYAVLPAKMQVEKEVLRTMFSKKDNWELSYLKEEAYTAEIYLSIIKNIKGVNTIPCLGQMADTLLKKGLMTESILIETLKIFSKKAISSNRSYIESMGGAVYQKHDVNDFLNRAKKDFFVLSSFSKQPNGQYYFAPINNYADYEKYEEKLKNLYKDIKPLIQKNKLEKILGDKDDKSGKTKI